MLKLKKIAVTGTVASGKSAVLNFFKELGAYTVDCDSLVHDLLKSDKNLQEKLLDLLGNSIVENGHLKRDNIAKIVFHHPEKLEQLEKIIHPFVFNLLQETYNKAVKENKHPLFVAEVPLLYETDSSDLFDQVIFVRCDPNVAKKRFNKPGYEERERRFFPPLDREKRSDITIDNHAGLDELKIAVEKIYQTLTRKSG